MTCSQAKTVTGYFVKIEEVMEVIPVFQEIVMETHVSIGKMRVKEAVTATASGGEIGRRRRRESEREEHNVAVGTVVRSAENEGV